MYTARLAIAAAVAILTLLGTTIAQENVQLQIPPSLIECYNTSFFMNRDNRLPATIDTLIAIIEKVENTYGYNQDMRQTAVSLLHRFRQDGIQRAPGVTASDNVIPYSPTGFQFSKFRILLSRLIPGNAFNFPNNTLSREERCSLHFMLSSSFDLLTRGDENTVCNQLSQYRTQRIPRAAPNGNGNNFVGDVEILENLKSRTRKRAGGMQMNPNSKGYDIDSSWSQTEFGYAPNEISTCPVENGVIWTRWGSVAAGPLIAGIAAGLQQQNVQLRTLIALSRRFDVNTMTQQQMAAAAVDNRWAATLSGDLAEVALVQMPESKTGEASVGANGGWNSTVMPKWYFLSQRQNLEMTDAEIRGGLDGLILAMNVAKWRTQVPSMKLSQLLRMYYSMDGVLGSGIMACNRKDNFPNVAPPDVMIAQTAAFAQILNLEISLKVTLDQSAIINFSTKASNALISYIPQYMNDVSCSVSNSLPSTVSDSVTPMTNIYIFLDFTWRYEDISDYIIYILQRLNIAPYGSTVSLLSAQDGTMIVNRTNFIDDVYRTWNISTHANYRPGFDLPTILRTSLNISQSLMNEQKANNSAGGHSLIALLVPYMTIVSESDSTYSTTQVQYINEQAPDLYYLYYGGGSMNRFSQFVANPDTDLFNLSPGSTIATSSEPILQRIKQIPRRIINPRCGAMWYSSSDGTDQMVQYARPGVTNFYRIAPNYFYRKGTNRNVVVEVQNSMRFTVCTSRSVHLPSQNLTNVAADQQQCTELTGNSYNYDLSNNCDGYKTIHQCPPVYLSVQAPSANGNIQTVSCTDPACQTPDQARYTIKVQNLGCFNGVAGLMASLTTMVVALMLSQAVQH